MALATYADLQTQVANWLHRSDLTTYIPDFITLFEAAAARRMKVRAQQTTVSLTTSGGSVALPSDYLGWQRLTWIGSPVTDLTYAHPSVLKTYYPTSPAGIPQMFTIESGNIKIMPTDDTGLELVYFKKTAALSTALNWLYTNHPDAYLFGTLCEAQGFNVAPDKLAMWKARRDEVFDEIRVQNFREPGNLSIRVIGYTP